jgi:hypothetical protein
LSLVMSIFYWGFVQLTNEVKIMCDKFSNPRPIRI